MPSSCRNQNSCWRSNNLAGRPYFPSYIENRYQPPHPVNILSELFLFALFGGLIIEGILKRRQRRHIIAHRDSVPTSFAAQVSVDAHQKAADYTCARLQLGAVDSIVGVGITILWTFGGGLNWIDRVAHTPGLSSLATGTLFLLMFLVASSLLNMPVRLYRIFVLEESFGFNRITPWLMLKDLLKQLALFLLLAPPLILCVLWLMAYPDRLWWLWAWLVWLAFSVLGTWVYPACIAPLFNCFRPLDNPALEQRIIALLQRNGFASQGVFVMDGSTRSTHGNAYFTGLGTHKRIVFFDTLIRELSNDEIEAVLAHELGHFKCRHIIQRMLFLGVLSFAALALLGLLHGKAWFYSGLGVYLPSDHQALALFLLGTPILMSGLQVFFSHISRRHEFEADDFAAAETRSQALINALMKLYRDNANTLTPDPWYSAVYDSHPPAIQRVAHLQGLVQTQAT